MTSPWLHSATFSPAKGRTRVTAAGPCPCANASSSSIQARAPDPAGPQCPRDGHTGWTPTPTAVGTRPRRSTLFLSRRGRARSTARTQRKSARLPGSLCPLQRSSGPLTAHDRHGNTGLALQARRTWAGRSQSRPPQLKRSSPSGHLLPVIRGRCRPGRHHRRRHLGHLREVARRARSAHHRGGWAHLRLRGIGLASPQQGG
jgi:hypothetical protein